MRTLRPFRPADADLLLIWRNSEAHRRWSFTDRMIDPVEHAGWFDRFLHDPRRIGFLLEDESAGPIGQIRFDPGLLPGMLTVSIGIAPEHLGKGVGTHLLREAVERPEVVERAVLVRAETFLENTPSRRIFEKCGFLDAGERIRDGHRYSEWLKPIGKGLSGLSSQFTTRGADGELGEVQRLLAALGCSETPADAPGSPILVIPDDTFLEESQPLFRSAARAYLVPQRGHGIIAITINNPPLPDAAATADGPLADRIASLFAWLAYVGRTGQ